MQIRGQPWMDQVSTPKDISQLSTSIFKCFRKEEGRSFGNITPTILEACIFLEWCPPHASCFLFTKWRPITSLFFKCILVEGIASAYNILWVLWSDKVQSTQSSSSCLGWIVVQRTARCESDAVPLYLPMVSPKVLCNIRKQDGCCLLP